MCSLKWVNKEIHVYTKGHCLCVLPIVISNTIQGSLDALSRVPFFPFLKKSNTIVTMEQDRSICNLFGAEPSA